MASKIRKKKSVQTALYGKIKENRERREVNGSLERTHKTYLTFQLEQHNTRQDKGA